MFSCFLILGGDVSILEKVLLFCRNSVNSRNFPFTTFLEFLYMDVQAVRCTQGLSTILQSHKNNIKYILKSLRLYGIIILKSLKWRCESCFTEKLKA